jgi:hypothetical protein
MRKLILFIIIVSGVSFSQDKEKKETNPCVDPAISYARKHGVKALPARDLLQYHKASKACKEMGGEAIIDQIHINEYNRDFQQSKFMSGWTSTYGMCVTAIIFYYFVGLITVEK